MADNYLMAEYSSIPIRLVSTLALFGLLFKRAREHQACFEEKIETGFFYENTLDS